MQLKQLVIPSTWKSDPRPQVIAHNFKLYVQRNSHQLKHNDHVINWTFRFRVRLTDREPMVSSQWFGHWFRQSDFVTKWRFGQGGSGDSKICFWSLFPANQRHLGRDQFVRGQLSWTHDNKPACFDLSGERFCPKPLGSKNFEQILRHQVVEAEAIEKLPLPHPWLLQPTSRVINNHAKNSNFQHVTKN